MAALRKKSDILFVSLPPTFDILAKVLKKIGHNVFYLGLSSAGQTTEVERRRASDLRELGVVPLPLESFPSLDGILNNAIDPQKKLQMKTNQLVPVRLLRAFENLYPNNTDVVSKLRSAVQSLVAGQMSVVYRVNCWARANSDRQHLLIDPSFKGLLSIDLASNVRLVFVPVDILFKGAAAIAQSLGKVLRVIVDRISLNRKSAVASSHSPEKRTDSRVAFVPHQGLGYGSLFDKTLFYSERSESELHPDNLLHFDYSNFKSPSEKIRWFCLGSERQSFLAGSWQAMLAMNIGIMRVRSASEFIGLLLLSRFYAIFRSYSKKIAVYPELKLALIDYEILCPKALLLAFESKHIKTVAVQERFITGLYESVGSVLNTYLCGSDYVAGVLKKSSSYHIDRCFPVGQYKSDNLVEAKKAPLPEVLRTPIAQGRKIVTALGFHTHMDWYNSQSDPLLNWTAHWHFLEDMIRLSKDIPNVFIILRFKMINWVSLPIFTKVVQEINSSGNMKISMDYEKSFFSYDLCAHSDLVIAKHTSLGDECLAAGIPVLFHEYTHNSRRLVADVFDYSPARIMCFDYQELLERARAVLMDDSAMASDYEHLKSVVYGDLGDGKVRERIHAHINALLEERL